MEWLLQRIPEMIALFATKVATALKLAHNQAPVFSNPFGSDNAKILEGENWEVD